MTKKRTVKPRGRAKAKKAGALVIGRGRFEKISSVEGIVITRDMKGRFVEFETKGLSAAERRESIKRAYRKG